MKVRIKNIPRLAFGDKIADILEGCDLTIQTGEEDSSSFLQGLKQRLGNVDHVDFSYLEITESIRISRGDNFAKEFNNIYTGMFGLMSLSRPIQIKVCCLEIVH